MEHGAQDLDSNSIEKFSLATVADFAEHRIGFFSRTVRVAARRVNSKMTHGAIAAVLTEDHEIVLVRQRLFERDRWSMPAGFIRRGELPADGAARELAEESGLSSTDVPLHHVMTYKQPWSSHYDNLYVGQCEEFTPISTRSIDTLSVASFPLDTLPPLTKATEYALLMLGGVNSD